MYHDLRRQFWVAGNEGRCRYLRIQMSYVSTSESRTSTTHRGVATVTSGQMEVGERDHGFHYRFTEIAEGTRCHLGDSRLIDQVSALFTYSGYGFDNTLSRLYVREIIRLHGILVSIVLG